MLIFISKVDCSDSNHKKGAMCAEVVRGCQQNNVRSFEYNCESRAH